MAKLEKAEQHALAKGVAAALSTQINTATSSKLQTKLQTELIWNTVKPQNWGDSQSAPLHLMGPNGEEFRIDTDWRDSSKVNISGEFPKGPKGEVLNSGEPSISVSLKRGHAVIASEIRRRLLPEYTPIFEEVQSRRRSATNSLDKKTDAAAKLTAVLGGLVKGGTNINREPIEGVLRFVYDSNRTPRLDGDIVCSDSDVNFKMDVSLPLALKLAQVIADHYYPSWVVYMELARARSRKEDQK